MASLTHRPRDVVVIAASAGGVPALRSLLTGIEPGFPGTIAIVQHRSPYHGNGLASVIADRSGHRVREPRQREPMERGIVYLAPRDRHLVMTKAGFLLERGPKEHFTRPAADALFRSAAESYGPRVAGVVLTGGGHDGASGLNAIKLAGGVNIVQHPDDSESPSMPLHALRACDPDAILRLEEMADAIARLMRGEAFPGP